MHNEPTKKHLLFSHLKAINFICMIWACFFIQIMIFFALGINVVQWGVSPHTVKGLVGIFTMPFLHGNFQHITMNSIGLLMGLLPLYIVFKKEAHVEEVILKIIVISGILVWIFGRQNAVHIGASALVYGLTVYIMVAGIVYRHPFLIICSAMILFCMGGSFISGMMPGIDSHISWEGHICGAIAGLLVGLNKKPGLPHHYSRK